jgi:hypothetical protein
MCRSGFSECAERDALLQWLVEVDFPSLSSCAAVFASSCGPPRNHGSYEAQGPRRVTWQHAVATSIATIYPVLVDPTPSSTQPTSAERIEVADAEGTLARAVVQQVTCMLRSKFLACIAKWVFCVVEVSSGNILQLYTNSHEFGGRPGRVGVVCAIWIQ